MLAPDALIELQLSRLYQIPYQTLPACCICDLLVPALDEATPLFRQGRAITIVEGAPNACFSVFRGAAGPLIQGCV